MFAEAERLLLPVANIFVSPYLRSIQQIEMGIIFAQLAKDCGCTARELAEARRVAVRLGLHISHTPTYIYAEDRNVCVCVRQNFLNEPV